MTKEVIGEEKRPRFEYRDVDELIPYARNARTHSPEQIQKLCGSLKEFGFLSPIVISEDGGILAGHGRVLASQKLGIKQVPCVVESHLTEAQKRAYILADNRLALDAGWDEEMLKIELNELNDLDFDMSLMGFSDEELKEFIDEDFLSETNGPRESHGNGNEELEAEVKNEREPVTQPGDVWILGEHRLICGDSTRADIVEKVLNGNKPHLMVTDPPYGTHYDPADPNSARGRIGAFSAQRAGRVYNDDRADWSEAYSLFPGEVAYVWHAHNNCDVVMTNLKDCGFNIVQMLVWNKSQFAFGRSDYHWKHEVCAYVAKGNHHWNGDRTQSTVWDIPVIRILEKEEGSWGHGTQKPIACMRIPIENNSKEGEWVYDPFCGSGTTIIACEQTGRRCIGIELDQHYCDAIVRRWETVSGKKAVLEGDGALFDDLYYGDDNAMIGDEDESE